MERVGLMPSAPRQYRPPHVTAAAKSQRKRYDQRRGSAAERGYGARWRKYREWFLGHPVNVLCGMCERAEATVIDHVDAVDGDSDARFWQPENHLAECRACHSTKTGMVDRAFGNQRTAEGVRLLERLRYVARERAKEMKAGEHGRERKWQAI